MAWPEGMDDGNPEGKREFRALMRSEFSVMSTIGRGKALKEHMEDFYYENMKVSLDLNECALDLRLPVIAAGCSNALSSKLSPGMEYQAEAQGVRPNA